MNALTRRLARAKACLCYRANSQPCNFILPLILFLSFLLWTSTPEGMLKSKLEFWMQRQPLAIETENQEEIKEVREEGLVGEKEERWLAETTEFRLWIGRTRPIRMLSLHMSNRHHKPQPQVCLGPCVGMLLLSFVIIVALLAV